jgi:6-hydroxytryprostatin B O-methyltransferase
MKFTDPFSANKTNGASKSSPLVRAAEDILHWATIISDHFDDHDLPQPSFDLDGPEDYPYELPDEIHDARAKLRGATSTMASLAAGPKGSLMWMCWNYHDISTLSYVHHFHIAEAVPLSGTIALSELATKTKTSLSQLKRVIRYLMLHHVFAEPIPGQIAHTPASRQLVTSEHVKAWIEQKRQDLQR